MPWRQIAHPLMGRALLHTARAAGRVVRRTYTGPRSDGAQLIVPGERAGSPINLRSLSTQPGARMPLPLRNRVDDRYVALLGQWIESLAG